MSEIKKTENGVTTKYKGVWNATVCVEEEFKKDTFTEKDLHDFVNRCGKYSEEKLKETVEAILSNVLEGKVTVTDFNYNFKEIEVNESENK